MKRRLVTALAAACAVSLLLAGCASSSSIKTDNLELTGYKGIEVDEVEKAAEVTDEDVDNAIQARLQENAASKEITDRAVEKGDIATIDFVGKIDGVEFEGGSGQDYPLEIGSGSFIEGFEDSIIGHNIGDTFDWQGKFPDDYQNTEFAGKDVVFTITVKGISQNEVPELDKDFVKSVSEKSKTVKEYKKEIKEQLKEEGETTYKDTLTAAVWQAVLDKAEVKKYPSKKVKKISDQLIDQYKSVAEYYQTDYETLITDQMGQTVEEFEKQVKEAAKSSVKQSMVTEAIAEKEKLNLSDDEYKKAFKKMAKDYGYKSVKELKQAADEKDLKEIALNTKVKEWLTDNCVQKASK